MPLPSLNRVNTLSTQLQLSLFFFGFPSLLLANFGLTEPSLRSINFSLACFISSSCFLIDCSSSSSFWADSDKLSDSFGSSKLVPSKSISVPIDGEGFPLASVINCPSSFSFSSSVSNLLIFVLMVLPARF